MDASNLPNYNIVHVQRRKIIIIHCRVPFNQNACDADDPVLSP